MVLGVATVPTTRECNGPCSGGSKTARAEMTTLIAHLDGKLYLSPGYYLELGADILILRRKEGSVVAAFSARAASPGEVARTAETDYRATGNRSR
jgi:hypothetical protein